MRSLWPALFVLLLCAAARGQEWRHPQLVVPLAGEGFVGFKLETVATSPAATTAALSGAETAVNPQVLPDNDNVIHRMLVDNAGNFIFGYDLVIVPEPAAKQFRVAVRPLAPEFEQQLRARTSGAKQRADNRLGLSTLARPAEAQTIDDGDAFTLDLLVNAQTGVKIVDVVKVSFDRARLWAAPPASPPRDFTVENVELAVKDYELLQNGERIGGGRPTHGVQGPLLWLYVPYQGRFIFSLTPRPGYDFRKVGTVEGNKITFTLGGDRYEWISSEPVVGRGGNWNLWVLLDAEYVPQYFPSARDSEDSSQRASAPRFSIGATTGGQFPTSVARKAVPEVKVDADAQGAKETKGAGPLRLRPRVMAGSADRMENLLPKQ